MASLVIKKETASPRDLILHLSGDFEGLEVAGNKEKLLAELEDFKGESFSLEIGEIEYIDSAALGLLLDMAKAAAKNNIRFGLMNVKNPVKKVLEVTRMDKVITVYNRI